LTIIHGDTGISGAAIRDQARRSRQSQPRPGATNNANRKKPVHTNTTAAPEAMLA
jgi:hypothetical protein